MNSFAREDAVQPSVWQAEYAEVVTGEYDVTSVGVNPADDRAHRMRVYFIAMSIRVACVASLFFVRGWWLLLVGTLAVVLPYFAVLVANAAEHNPGARHDTPEPLELTGTPAAPAQEAASETTIVIDAPAERRSSQETQ